MGTSAQQLTRQRGENQFRAIQSMSAPQSQPKAKAANNSVKLNTALSLFFLAEPN
jgi:hypothetical protein